MPSLVDAKQANDDDDSGFFLIEPWFCGISLMLLLVFIIMSLVKIILDKPEPGNIYFGNLTDPGTSPLKKLINPRVLIMVCAVLITFILIINFIAELFRSDDDEN